MNPIDNFIKNHMSTQEFLSIKLPEDPQFRTDYHNLITIEKEIRELSYNFTSKMLTNIRSKHIADNQQEQLKTVGEIKQAIAVPKFSHLDFFICPSTSFIIMNVTKTLSDKIIFSKQEDLSFQKVDKPPILLYNTISKSESLEISRPLRKEAFDENKLSVVLFSFELMKRRTNLFVSYFSSFEIRSPVKQKTCNYIIKEENFLINPPNRENIKKEYSETVPNTVVSGSDFMPPKIFKIISNKQDNLSLSINENKSLSQINKYVYTMQKNDLNKSELVITDNDLNHTTSNIIGTDIDNSIIINKNNNEVKKTDKLIEQLNLKLEPFFEQFEKDEITPQQINEIVKKELTTLRPLFISSKNIKEKVFQALSKGNNDKYMFLNHVFKTIIEESLKNMKNVGPNIRAIKSHNQVFNTQIPKNTNDDLLNKKILDNTGNRSKVNLISSPNYDHFIKVYPSSTKKIKTVISSNKTNYDSNIVQRKSANQKGNHLSGISNEKSIHTKNNINISIQPIYKKEKYEFTELPYIK